MPTIRTNDSGARAEFKEKLAAKAANVTATAPVFVSDTPQERVYSIPENWAEVSEAALLHTLLHTPDWKYDLSSANYVAAILYNREPKPDYVSFALQQENGALSPLDYQTIPQNKRGIETPPSKSAAWIAEQVDKRNEFKSRLVERVSSAQLAVPEPEKHAARTLFQLPEGYADMTETTLSAALMHSTEWQYTIETAANAVSMVFGKTAIPENTQFCVGDSQIAYTAFPVKKVKKQRKVIAAYAADSSTEKLAEEVVTRHQFKAQLSERAATQPVEPITRTDETVTVEIPFNFYDLSDLHLLGHVRYLNPYISLAQAEDVVHIVRERDQITDTHFGFSLGKSYRPEIVQEPETHTPTKKVIDLLLPYTFEYQRTVDQFTWLRKEAGLSDSDANDVIDFVAGKPIRSNTEFNVTYSEVPAPAEFRPAKKAFSTRPVKPTYEDVSLPAEFFTNLTPEERHNFLVREYGLTPEHALHVLQTQTPPEELLEQAAELIHEYNEAISVVLPAEFKSYRPREQYLWLQTKFGPEQAKDIIDIVDGRREDANYTISFSSSVLLNDNPISKFLQGREDKPKVSSFTRLAKQVKVTTPAVPVPVRTLSVSIPAGIAGLRSRDQYTYFTGYMQWTPEDANEIVAHLAGQETRTVFEIEFTEE